MTAEHRTPSQRPEDTEPTERQEQHLGDESDAPIVTPTPERGQGAAGAEGRER
ncbi:hypothetical protein [Kitasatospora cheerisanensis]|uniref:hypothetical protein n=1 Tax=Kitasatospora cheerisanensis TaxID=81942 RepID=UPI000AE20C1F|nr:hypothetical protein [Kitasatospora cheerisanensis]